jgi:hypothetical protein
VARKEIEAKIAELEDYRKRCDEGSWQEQVVDAWLEVLRGWLNELRNTE